MLPTKIYSLQVLLKKVLLACFVFFACKYNAQEASLHKFISKNFSNYNYPLQLITQTDTSVVILSEVYGAYGRDLLLTKYSISDTSAIFEKRLNADSLFEGKFNQKEINFYIFENNGNISCFLEKKSKHKSLVYARSYTNDGHASRYVVIDSVEKKDKNLDSFRYKITQSSNKKNAIVVCRRDYLSGFRRDKCILVSLPDLDKKVEMELPKNSITVSENYNFDTDFQNNIFYAVFNKYNTEKDSLIIFKIDYKTKNLQQFKIPEMPDFVTFKPLFSNQIIMYGITNLYFKNSDSLKKGVYYRKMNLNNCNVLMDTVALLSHENQGNLTYSYKSLSKQPISKIFTLVSDDIIDGHLVTVFEHNHHSVTLSDLNRRITVIDPRNVPSTITEKLEYLVASLNMATGKVEYTGLMPKKIIYNSNRYQQTEMAPFSCVYNNGEINLSAYEHRANINTMPNVPHSFNAFKQVTNNRKVNTVVYGNFKKKLISFNLREHWRPLDATHIYKTNKIYFFSYTKKSIKIAYYKLSD